MRTFTLAILVLMLAAPSAAATHWTLYYAGATAEPGTPHEDDGVVLDAPGNVLHGYENRISPPGVTPGDGGLFLDARVSSVIGSSTAPTPDFYTETATGETLGRHDLLLPTTRRISAWYGWWTDIDGNGAVADVHDGACGPAGCPADEFRWRGHGSDDAVAVIAYVVPGERFPTGTLSPWAYKPSQLGSFNKASTFELKVMEDKTSWENPEQSWTASLFANYDGGFLMTLHTLVAAGAPPSIGSPTEYALDDPAALLDVDRYTAIAPEVESLYTSSVPVVRATLAMLSPDDLAPAADAFVQGARDDADEEKDKVYVAVADGRAAAIAIIASPDDKEPNSVFDDFEGRAMFGGVGGHDGAYNTYDGYLGGYHLYFDNVARGAYCAGAWATVPGTSIVASAPADTTCQSSSAYFDPPSQADAGRFLGSEDRTSGFSLLFEGHIFLWKDLNADTHVGTVCDPATPAFDAERNTCTESPHPYPHGTRSQEAVPVCAAARATDTTFTVRPLGGPWSNAVLVRDMRDTTRVAFDQHWEVLTGTDEVTLRWRSDCISGSGKPFPPDAQLYARDALWFPAGGSRVPLVVTAEVSIAAFNDASLGISEANERVLDVDVLPAMM